MKKKASIFRHYGQVPQIRANRGAHDDLVVAEDAEDHFRETVSSITEPVSLTSHYQSKTKYSSGGNNTNSLDGKTNSDVKVSIESSSPSNSSRKLLFSKPLRSDSQLESGSTGSNASVPSTQNKEEPEVVAQSVPLKRPTVDISLPSYNFRPVISMINEPVHNRMAFDLPLSQLSCYATKNDALVESIGESIRNIEKNVEKTNSRISELDNSVRNLSGKTISLSQTSEVVLGKLSVLDDWIEGLGKAGGDIKMQAIEWFVKLLSLLSSLVLLFWNSIKRLIPKRKKEKLLAVQKSVRIIPSATDESTGPGNEEEDEKLSSRN